MGGATPETASPGEPDMKPEPNATVARPARRSWHVLAVTGAIVVFLWVLLRDAPPRYNAPLAATESENQLRPPQPGNSPSIGMWGAITHQDDKTLMMAAFSGGGSRAAAVAWKTLETLQSIPYISYNGQDVRVESNLAREIDLVAGISGGSFAATAWCLSREDLGPFRKRFVERNIQRALARSLISLGGLKALISRRYSRIDVAAELYDREVFDGATFGDLPERPLLLVHATDLGLGQRFTFVPETFSLIGSRLASYPLGFACAASSAFPILLNPITLRNYGPPPAFWNSAPVSNRLEAARMNERKDLESYFLRAQWEHYHDAAKNPYLHLADGGLADNQGLQSLLDQFKDGVVQGRLNATPALARWVAINVNAGVNSDGNSGRSPSAPSVPSVVEGAMVTSMDLLSAKRWEEVRTASDTLYKALQALRSARGETDPSSSLLGLEKPYLIEINFRNIQDPELRRQAQSLPTSFKLSADQLALIDAVVPRLVYEDPSLQRLVMVQLAEEILRALPEDRRAALKSRFQGKDVDLSVIGPTELEAVRQQPEARRLAARLLQVLLQGLPTLNHNGFNLERLKEISAGLKDV